MSLSILFCSTIFTESYMYGVKEYEAPNYIIISLVTAGILIAGNVYWNNNINALS